MRFLRVLVRWALILVWRKKSPVSGLPKGSAKIRLGQQSYAFGVDAWIDGHLHRLDIRQLRKIVTEIFHR